MAVKFTKPEINVREKLAELDKPSGIAGEAMLRAETPQEQFNLIGAGRRNLLINGDFQVSQRGDYTSASSANVSYFVDRWYTDVANAVSANRQHISGIDIPDTPSISKGVRLVATSSGTSYIGVRQKIENPTQYVGRTFTYSGWVRSNTPNARLTSYGQGSPNQVIVSQPHSGSGKWEKLSVTFTLFSSMSNAWYVSAFLSTAGIGSVAQVTGDYIEVTQLQMELGKVATPFEHRSYGEELALCQRYYASYGGTSYTGIVTGVVYNNVSAMYQFLFPHTMRATPSISFSNLISTDRIAYDSNVTALQTQGISNNAVCFKSVHASNSASARQGCLLAIKNGSTGFIAFSAEL